MEVHIFSDYQTMSKETAKVIIELVNKKTDALICLPSGSTPTLTLRYLVGAAKVGKVDFSQCHFVGLDEWVGLGREDEGSCQHYLYEELFVPLEISDQQISFFNTKTDDLQGECRKIDEVIKQYGSIDFMLLGLGMNGHLGLNEPGVAFDSPSHVVDLDQTTKVVGQKYFQEETALSQGITLGCQHILDADVVILQVNGEKKADIVKGFLESDITNEIPATILKKHSHAHVFLDEASAQKIR